MVSSINSTIALSLLGGSSSGASGVSADLLTSWAKAKAGIGADTATATQDPNAPLAPVWTTGITPDTATLVKNALGGKAFFDTNTQLYSDLGATGDYKRLFALYSGLTTLQGLAARVEDKTISSAQKAQTLTQFTRGMTELQNFFAQQNFDDVRLVEGDRVDSTQSTLTVPVTSEDYQTGIIQKGGLYQTVPGLADDAQFTIQATSLAGTVRNVDIDLSEMGSLTRSLSNVITFINGKLTAAGAASRLQAVDQTPKTVDVKIGSRTLTQPYVGPKQYSLMVDVRGGEKVAFSSVDNDPAFYALGTTATGARLIKLQDAGGAPGEPATLDRPAATSDPIGPDVATGWLGPGAPYTTAAGSALEQRTPALLSSGANNFESLLRAPGEAVLSLDLGDGRTVSVSTAWQDDDIEAWRARTGESSDRAIADDLAERLTQLLHEQGVASGVDVWEDSGEIGFSIQSGDQVHATSLRISGRSAALTTVPGVGDIGGLRDGVFARRFDTGTVAASNTLFTDEQTFSITTATGGLQTIVIDGGTDGVDAPTIADRLNDKLQALGIHAAASFADDGNGGVSFRIDALHDVLDVNATLNGVNSDATLQAPGAWANGGLPAAAAGEQFGDATRGYSVSGAPLSTYTGAVDLQIVVATPTGDKTISVSVSALERTNDPDQAPGQWSQTFQDRLNAALNAAGVYVSADSADLAHWSVAEGASQRIASISINGNPLSMQADAPAQGIGGALSAERSFTSAQAATGVSDDVAALQSDQSVSISFGTAWGEQTISASLQPGDPPTLESAALRLNEALAAAGYDIGVEATPLSGGGAGLRVITGASHTVRNVSDLSIGGQSLATTLDPIDSASHADDPVGAASVADRAARGASATETIDAVSPFEIPNANAAAWFAGRAFDVAIGGGAKVATARAVAAGADGAVYVLADLSGDSATSAIKGSRDVALLKYDSAGKLQFTHVLGAAQSADGFALAVSADGKVAIAGSVEGALSGTTAKGGADSFVSLYDTNGKELWTARRGAAGDDEARAIAFASDGSVIVSGKTTSALPSQVALGGADGYVRAYSASGSELFTRQFGTGGDDAATALLVQDNGSGGFDIYTGGVENNRGVIRSFSYASSTGFSAGATRDIGYFYGGAINALASDNGALYVGGQIGADRLTLGTAARGAVAGKEGFVARIDTNLASTGLDRATYLGSAQDDSVQGLCVINGVVYAAGNTGGVVAGQGSAKVSQAFLTRLDDAGDAEWTRTFASAGGAFSMTSLAVDPTGVSPLDALGLPRGMVATNDPNKLVNRTALRVGDQFQIGADGKRLTTITINASDTLESLAASITRAIGSAGRAEIIKANGVESIKITPRSNGAVRITAGPDGKDALGALGFAQGVVAVNSDTRGSLKTYGLGLIAADLKLDSTDAIARTKAELSAAVSMVRQAYDTLLHPNAKPLTDEEKALQAKRDAAGTDTSGYYATQLANYQAALARLTGGG